MAVAGVGSGALVAALPAAAAAAAPPERTGFATGMTNATKTVGGAIASSIFAIALASTGSLTDPTEGHAPVSGYLTVWAVCAVAALLAACALLVMPGAPRSRGTLRRVAQRRTIVFRGSAMPVPENEDTTRAGRPKQPAP